MKFLRAFLAIVVLLVFAGGGTALIIDGLKQKAAKDAQDKLHRWRTWDLTNNDPAYWQEWSDQRNYFADKQLESGLLTFGGRTPELPKTAEEYLQKFDHPRPYRDLYIERLDMNEFQKVNAEFLKRYPIVSLEDRLRYENDRIESAPQSDSDLHASKLVTIVLHDQWNEYYEVTEVNNLDPSRPLAHSDYLSRGRRHMALATLHGEGLKAFANATDFGFDRTPQINLYDLHTQKEAGHVKLPQTDYIPGSYSYHVDLQRDYNRMKKAEKWVFDNLRKDYPKYMHLAFYHQFTEDDSYVKDFRQAAGFEPHAVRNAVNWRYDLFRPMQDPGWQVQRMELMSLLKFAEPAVYISDALPNMKQLVNGKTRPLDDFESNALQKIRTGEFIVTEPADPNLRMVGAIRAGETCIECHAVKAGELLGAFSYVLKKP